MNQHAFDAVDAELVANGQRTGPKPSDSTPKNFYRRVNTGIQSKEINDKCNVQEKAVSHVNSWPTATTSASPVPLLQPPASSESVNEKSTHKETKNCPSEAPEGDSYKDLSTLCNAGDSRRMAVFLIAAFPGR